jgi:outer membrane protein OmpA-like peptidoglycan-associated protein
VASWLSIHGIRATKRAGISRRKPRLVLPRETAPINIPSMSADTIEDAGDALPLHGDDRLVGDTPEVAADGKATQVRPKARTKRPRPTFDDGSVTRVFKFPSKAYPRSSYYVTSTEIIIRIKKARKKWKLVVPKKRVAGYRTNRWFAKPRWVEIELSYTQASKLGLVEPRTRSKEVTSGASAAQQAVKDPIVDSDHTLHGSGSGSEPEPDSPLTLQRPFDFDPNIQLLSTDTVDFASNDDPLDNDDALLRSLHHDGSQDANVCRRQSTFAMAAARPLTDRAAPRASAFLLIASSASVLVSMLAAWITFSGLWATPMTVDVSCARSEQSSRCTQMIVTGAVGNMDQQQSPESRPSSAFAMHASSEPMSANEQLQLRTPQIPDIATMPTKREDGSEKAGHRVDSGHERTGTANAAGEGNPLPAVMTPKPSPLPQNVSADRHDCRELRAASQSINIRFGYGSSSLNQAILPALESFAMRLRSCPSTKVIIEGHTDSDGRAAWNQSLSVHRAKVVLEHLVHAGVPPSQLSAVGFGQSRPYAPNVSPKNKRSNRRAALVVDVPR